MIHAFFDIIQSDIFIFFVSLFLCFACEITHFSIFIITIKERIAFRKWHLKRHFTWKVHVLAHGFLFFALFVSRWHLGNLFFWPHSVSVDWVNCNSFCMAPLNMIDVEGCTRSNSKSKKRNKNYIFSSRSFLNAVSRCTHYGKLSAICYANATV